MPVVLTILGDIFTLKERATIQGFFSAVWGTASLAGPALGVFLVNTLGWRSVFYVNLPFGAVGLVVMAWKYHDKEKPHTTDLDLPGIVLLAIACAAIQSLFSRLGPDGWPWQSAAALLVIAIGAIIWFAHVERVAKNPVMPPSMIMQRAIGPSLIGSCLLGVGFLSLDTYVPLYVQAPRAAARRRRRAWSRRSCSPGRAAEFLPPRWSCDGDSARRLMGCMLTTISFSGLLICAIVNAPHWVLTAVLFLSGFGFGPASMAYLLATQNAVTWQQRGIATSASSSSAPSEEPWASACLGCYSMS